MKTLFNSDTIRGITTTVLTRPDEPDIEVVQKTYDRQPILDFAASVRNELDFRRKELRPRLIMPIAEYHKLIMDKKIREGLPVDGGLVMDPRDTQKLYDDPKYKNLRLS